MTKNIDSPAMSTSARILPLGSGRMSERSVPDTRDIQVDGGIVEAVISEKRIGERIKYLRLKRSMGLVELGRHTGLSASFLSQLETGRGMAALRDLGRVGGVFLEEPRYFF